MIKCKKKYHLGGNDGYMGALEQQRVGIQNSKENIAKLLQWLCEQAKETGKVLVCTKVIVELCAIRE